jgi:hypothetical protein
MNGFGAEPHGIPRSDHPAHRRRARASTKAQLGRAEMALHAYRARAAAILHAEGLHEEREQPHSSYVFKIVKHRETGVRVRVLDTLADDAPQRDGQDVVHQYVVQCQTHGHTGPSFASARAAMVAARRPEQWCPQCSDLARARAGLRIRVREAEGSGARPRGPGRP